jgi:hypothetical protein
MNPAHHLKLVRVVILAAIVAAVVVRVGFALSLQSGSFQSGSFQGPVVSPSSGAGIVASTSISAPGLLGGSRYTPVPRLPTVPDGATLFGLGTLLLGLAAAVRRVV